MQANSLGGSEGSSRTEERIAYLSKELGIGHCPTGSPGGNVDNSVTGMPYKKKTRARWNSFVLAISRWTTVYY